VRGGNYGVTRSLQADQEGYKHKEDGKRAPGTGIGVVPFVREPRISTEHGVGGGGLEEEKGGEEQGESNMWIPEGGTSAQLPYKKRRGMSKGCEN